MNDDVRKLQNRLRQAMKEADPATERNRQPPQAPQAPTGLPTSVSAPLMRPVKGSVRLLSLSIVAAVSAAVVWSTQAVVQEVTVGQGHVVPAGKVRKVQYYEGGIVKDILAHEGDRVKKGQLLLRIDPTGAGSLLGKNRALLAGLRARIIRLKAQLAGRDLLYGKDFAAAHPALVAQNRKLYAAARHEIASALAALDDKARQKSNEMAEARARIASLGRAVAIAQKQLNLIAPLARDHVASRAELLAAKSKLNELKGQKEALELSLPRLRAGLEELRNLKAEKKNNFRARTLTELNETQVKFAALSQSLTADADKLRRTGVRSPVDGVIKAMHVNTIGQVVKPGGEIAEIVPATTNLLIETRFRPQDIAFLRPGEPAVVKLTAYDYTIYGALKGRLERISADSVTDEKGHTFYLAEVRTDANYLPHKGKELPVIPGMVAQVDIITGEKTIFQYVTKPLHRMASESFHER